MNQQMNITLEYTDGTEFLSLSAIVEDTDKQKQKDIDKAIMDLKSILIFHANPNATITLNWT